MILRNLPSSFGYDNYVTNQAGTRGPHPFVVEAPFIAYSPVPDSTDSEESLGIVS